MIFSGLKRNFLYSEKIILRDYLALERTSLANERTLFAYIRTSLYLLLAAIAFFKLKDFESLKWLAYVCLILSLILIGYGVARYLMLRKKLLKFYKQIDHDLDQHLTSASEK